MANTFDLIASNTLNASTSTVTFSSIASTYSELYFSINARSTTTATSYDTLYVRFNGATSGYQNRVLYGSGNAGPGAVADITTDKGFFGVITSDTNTANVFANGTLWIYDYAASKTKIANGYTAHEEFGNPAYLESHAITCTNASALSSVTFLLDSGSFKSGSTFYLYGITRA
jgi:hypothetical protein